MSDINKRMNRVISATMPEIFPTDGISQAFLHQLKKMLKADRDLANIATREIVERLTVVNNVRNDPSISLCSLLKTKTKHSNHTTPIVSHATCYLSHCRDYRFIDLIGTLAKNFPQSLCSTTYVWIDAFCLSPTQLIRHDWCSISV